MVGWLYEQENVTNSASRAELDKMFSIAGVQTKANHCISSNNSRLLQIMHTKAIIALKQFCDLFLFFLRKPIFFKLRLLFLGKLSLNRYICPPKPATLTDFSLHLRFQSEIRKI